MTIKQNPQAKLKFETYPETVQNKMKELRDLILITAAEIASIQEIEETLKWGEPSYIVKKGSTIRIDWKSKSPHQYAMYFNCKTSLVETFKVIYGELFKYEKNRAILLDLDEAIPQKELKDCIGMALQYHRLKDKPFLGR